MVPFVRLVQSRMHGLKKRNKSVMIEPDVKASGFFRFYRKLIFFLVEIISKISRAMEQNHKFLQCLFVGEERNYHDF